MSDDGGFQPVPLVLDATVLIAAAQGDHDVLALLQGYDADGQPLVIPSLAVTAASLDMPTGDAEAVLRGLERLDGVMAAPLNGSEQAIGLARVIARTGLDTWDAHTAQVADASVCPVLTLDGAKWREHAHDLSEPLHFIEIAESDEE